MLQHADPDFSDNADGTDDALRLQVEQIIAQRLERSRLKKAKPDTAPDASESMLRRPSQRLQDAAPGRERDTDFESEFGASDADFAAFEAERFETESVPADKFESDRLEEPKPIPPLSHANVEEFSESEPPARLLDQREGERRQGDRRNVEFMRTELPWSTSSDNEEKRGLFGRLHLRPSRFILVIVALASASIAGGLALSNSSPSPVAEPVTEPVAAAVSAPTTRVLIAAEMIGAGERLTEKNLIWQEVPLGGVLQGYISSDAEPEALSTYDQSVARYPFFPGDPIRTDKLLTSPQQSLASALSAGMRGVSVVVTADAAAGGFIKPDDFVDVVLAIGSEGQRVTRTVLQDVRVLAINAQLGPSTTGEAADDAAEAPKVFEGMALATLELDPEGAEVLVRAAANGSLTLTLRAPMENGTVALSSRSGANQAIRLTSGFWNDSYSPGVK